MGENYYSGSGPGHLQEVTAYRRFQLLLIVYFTINFFLGGGGGMVAYERWLRREVQLYIQLFQERLSEKAKKCMQQDQKVVWVYIRILHIGLEKCTSL